MKPPVWRSIALAVVAIVVMTGTILSPGIAEQPGGQISSGQLPPRSPQPKAQTLKATVPAVVETVCTGSSQSAGLSCKPTGVQSCPSDVLYRSVATASVQVCVAACLPQSAGAGTCDCTFTTDKCRDRPGR